MFSSAIVPCLLAAVLIQTVASDKSPSDAAKTAATKLTTDPKEASLPKVIKVSTLDHVPYCYKDEDDGPWKGFLIDVMEEIKTQLNLTEYKIVSEKEKFTDFSSAGAWEDVVDDVVGGKADVGLAGLYMTPARIEKVDFSIPLLHYGYSLVHRTPQNSFQVHRSVFFCLAPFSSGVWACIIISLFVTVALLMANSARNPRERAQRMVRGELRPATSEEALTLRDHLSQAFWFVLSSTALQSGAKQPMSVAGRLLALTWWLFAGLTVATYVVALLMDLVASSGYQEPPFINMVDLMKSWVAGKDYRVHFQHQEVRERFSGLPRPWLMFLNSKAVTVMDDARRPPRGSLAWVKAMLNESDLNLIVMSSDATRTLIEKMDCGSVRAAVLLDDRYVGLVFPRAATKLRLAVNQVLLGMTNNGHMRQLQQKYGLRDKVKCGLGFDRSDPQQLIRQVLLTEAVADAVRGVAEMFYDSLPITMAHFAGILVLFIIGVIFAFCGVAVDFYIYTHPEGFKHNEQILSGADPRDEILDTPEIQNLNEA